VSDHHLGKDTETVSRPNFDKYLRPESTPDERKGFSYFLIGTSCVTIGIGAVEGVRAVLTTMSPAADVLAMANIEVDVSNIAEGDNLTVKWRGKPLFVRHRTDEEIASAQEDDSQPLRHAETDASRTKNPKFLVVLGVCTHLGCVPIAKAGDFGGYFCPCHGSHYDTSGRIRKGPAPLNLEVPPHTFVSEDKLLVGVDEI
jgi:ubiquinol-cytochrome c reductase iron-sulfur subunit